MADAESTAARLARLPRKSTCTLTHHGRKSRKPYRVTIWFTVDGDHLNLQTMNVKRQWVRNVLANPQIKVQIGDEVLEGTLRPVTDAEMPRVVQLMKKKYPISLPYLWWKGKPDGAFRMTLI